MKSKLFKITMILVLLLIVLAPVASAAPTAVSGEFGDPEFVQKVDNKPDPLSTRQAELKEMAMDAKLNGKAYGKTYEVARGQYVELAREGEGALWTVLGEFADFPHNSIAEPDRAVDNTTLWVPDFSRDYYMDLLFNEAPGANSMRNFYIEQSSNRYTVHGDVTDWIPVPNDACLLR
jgi:immune inhibitor A